MHLCGWCVCLCTVLLYNEYDRPGQMHANTRDTECCLGPALSAAGKVMGHVGGKMVVLCSSLPSTGEARLKHRENPRSLGTEREHLLLSAEDPWYQVRRVGQCVPGAGKESGLG